MSGVISNVGEEVALSNYLEIEDLTLKLYSNNLIPSETDTAGSFTEVSGGGYAAKTLDKDNWTITPGAPTQGTYAAQNFTFTGATDAPGNVYGYYIVDGSGVLRGAERFNDSVVPFVPVNGSIIRITPKFEVS